MNPDDSTDDYIIGIDIGNRPDKTVLVGVIDNSLFEQIDISLTISNRKANATLYHAMMSQPDIWLHHALHNKRKRIRNKYYNRIMKGRFYK